MSSYQRGVALIQVLLVTSILSVLALYMTQTAKSQIQQAKWMNNKAQAHIELHSAESELLFELFTQKKSTAFNTSRNQGDYQISNNWNFYATTFKINNVDVRIQDQSGLINLNYPDILLLKKLILSSTESESQTEINANNLLDWIDVDNISRPNGAEALQYGGFNNIRNGGATSVYEVNYLKSFTPATKQLLIRNSTVFQSGAFSPINAPIEILAVLTNQSAVEQISALRELNQLNIQKFSDITGIIEDDDIYFYTSNYLMIELTSSVRESKVHKKMYVFLQPYAQGTQSPINTYVNRG